MEFITPTTKTPDDTETVVYCCCCGRKISIDYDDYTQVSTDEFVCDDCKSSVTTCMRCGAEILRDDAKTGRDGQCLCEYCWDDLYVTC